MADDAIKPDPVIFEVIEQALDKKRMSEGIRAVMTRAGEFSGTLEMQLAGIAMVPEARQLMSDTLTSYWDGQDSTALDRLDLTDREVVIGGGYHAAVYAACRVLAGYPKPVILERGTGEEVGGVAACSLSAVFRLNSRNRPGMAGLPDQDTGLNFFPTGTGIPQLSMLTSQEYADNADWAWVTRLLLAQYAEVYTGVTVTRLSIDRPGVYNRITLGTSQGGLVAGRVLDARGCGQPDEVMTDRELALTGSRILTFRQLMRRMGSLFPLRGMQQVAIIGGGNSALCSAESLLGIAPGHTSVIGLDYVRRADLYATTIDGATCEEFREGQRGRYIRLGQYLAGNTSSPTTRLTVIPQLGYASRLPQGVLVNDRTYDMALMCTGGTLPSIGDSSLSFLNVRAGGREDTVILARQTRPYELFRIGPAAGIPFSDGERAAGIAANSNNKVAMFRLGPRTAALAGMLPAPGGT